jgi:Tol biopolymer transport system component
MPLAGAVSIATQITLGLEAAHEQGIVHRDLKPANIKIRTDGTVKVLDFGLAKLTERAGTVRAGRDDVSRSPTLTSPVAMTGMGMILGTAAYMAPEQARGQATDKRADIWAFGVVFYEMLTGRRLFDEGTVSDTLAAVLKDTPRWEGVPARALPLLRRCLEKDPKRRLRDIGDAMALMEDASQPAAVTSVRRASWLWPSAAALLGVALASLAVVHYLERPPTPPEPTRFQIVPPEKVTLSADSPFAVSPDGRTLVYGAAGSDNVVRLWLRALDSLETRPLAGTEINGVVPPPFWSPDGRFVAFDDGLGKLKKVDITGGPAQTLCDVPTGVFVGGSWNDEGVIIFAMNFAGVMRVSAGGGVPTPVTTIDSSRREVTQVFPVFLPDGRHFLYYSFSNGPEGSGIYVGSLDAKPDEQRSAKLLATSSGTVAFVPSDSASAADLGHLLFRREGTLMAQPFDDRSMVLSGEPVPVAGQLGSFLANGFFSASQKGVLVYRTGGVARQNSQPTWFDREGTRLGNSGEPGNYLSLTLSPDSARAAAVRLDVQTVIQDLWLLDLEPGTSTRLTFGPSFVTSPVWSPDGNRVVFGLSPDGGPFDLYQKPVNGATDEKTLLKSTSHKTPTNWSRDGRYLLYTESDPRTKNDVWLLSLEGGKAVPFLNSAFNEGQGQFSSDGRFVVYVSDESGRSEVYVRESSANAAGAKSVVSKTGGSAPRWRADAKELFYAAPDGTIMAVEVTAGAIFQASTPKPTFKLPTGVSIWDVTANGSRFLLAVPVEQSDLAPFTVVLNWQQGLTK